MNEIEIILLMMVLIHFVADFILQTDKQAKGKSTSHYSLASHVLVLHSHLIN